MVAFTIYTATLLHSILSLRGECTEHYVCEHHLLTQKMRKMSEWCRQIIVKKIVGITVKIVVNDNVSWCVFFLFRCDYCGNFVMHLKKITLLIKSISYSNREFLQLFEDTAEKTTCRLENHVVDFKISFTTL